jgi:uncharacterized tellurite resistance protein B-like protein
MSMLDRLARNERMRLMKFVCSFAWADLEIHPEERAFIKRMVSQLTFDEDDREKVQGWLEVPPDLESIDPTLVPPAHREAFLEAIRGVIEADGVVVAEEYENFRLFRDLVG